MNKSNRPIVNVPTTKMEKLMNSLSLLVLIITYSYIFIVWNELPDQVPAHYNALGEVDRWGGKGNIVVLPIIGTIIFLTFTTLSKFPHRFNYLVEITLENAEKQYKTSKRMISTLSLVITLFFATGTYESIQISMGKDGFGIWHMPIFLFSLFGIIGYYMYRSFQNR